MKAKPRLLVCLAFVLPLLAKGAESAPAPTSAAVFEVQPQLRGFLATDGERQFSLVSPGRVAPMWVKLGGKFDGWELAEFKAAEEALVLKKDGRSVVLKLAASPVKDDRPAGTKATVADAEEVLQKIGFDRMLTKVIDQNFVVSMTKQVAQSMGEPDTDDAKEWAAYQKKVTDAFSETISADGLKGDVAKIYSEVFTKEELRGIADFYSTGAGRALSAKEPEISQKMNALFMPRMMTAIPKLQALTQEFQERLEKQEAERTPVSAESTAEAPKSVPKE